MRSNRTFMELKWSKRPLPAAQSFSSNRTFMELKYLRLARKAEAIMSSNRTFMELKSGGRERQSQDFAVLIVPLWN